MIKILCCVATVVLFSSVLFAAQPSNDAEKVWSMEKAYWEYVQAKDLQKYRTLWHPDFLGWPSVSPEPLRKDHITDWITAYTEKGETLKSYDLEKLAVQVTGNIATSTYRIHQTWVNKGGAAQTSVSRIIHTWVRDTAGVWHIISGMSAPTNADGH